MLTLTLTDTSRSPLPASSLPDDQWLRPPAIWLIGAANVWVRPPSWDCQERSDRLVNRGEERLEGFDKRIRLKRNGQMTIRNGYQACRGQLRNKVGHTGIARVRLVTAE